MAFYSCPKLFWGGNLRMAFIVPKWWCYSVDNSLTLSSIWNTNTLWLSHNTGVMLPHTSLVLSVHPGQRHHPPSRNQPAPMEKGHYLLCLLGCMLLCSSFYGSHVPLHMYYCRFDSLLWWATASMLWWATASMLWWATASIWCCFKS